MKRIFAIFLLIAVSQFVQGQAQLIPGWYEYWQLQMDSVFSLPQVSAYPPYRRAGSTYFNASDRLLHWWTGSHDTTFSGGGGGIPQIYAKPPIFTSGTDTVWSDTSTINTGLTTLYQNAQKITKPYFLGNLYVKDNWTSTADFTQIGSFPFSVSGGHLTISGGNQTPSATIGTSNPAFNQVVEISAYGGTMLERWTMIDTFVINNTPSASTTGQGIGTVSTTAGIKSNAIAYFNASTGTGAGTVSLLLGANNTTAVVSPTSVGTVNNGDTIIIRLERIEDRLIGTAKDKTTNSATVTAPFTFDQSNSNNILTPNTGQFAIVNFGGAYIHNGLNVYSHEMLYSNIAGLGDSKLAGYATGWDQRILSVINQRFPGTIGSSGEGDRTQDALNHLNEFINLKPQFALLCIGRNDVANGISPAIYQANLDSIGARFNRAGIPFATFDAIYETAVNQAPLIGFIDTALIFNPIGQPSKVYPTYAPGNFAGTVANDGVHPNSLGARIVAENTINQFLLTNYGKFLNNKNEGKTSVPAFDSVIISGTINANKISTNGLGPYPPSQGRQSGDYIMCAGCAVTSAYGLSAFTNRFICSNTFQGAFEFDSYVNNGLNTPQYIVKMGGASGIPSAALQITAGGAILTGSAVVGSTANNGDVFLPYGTGSIWSAITNDGKHESRIRLHNNATASMEFYNKDSLGQYLFYQSMRSPGTTNLTMDLDSLGNLLLGTGSDNQMAKLQVTGAVSISDSLLLSQTRVGLGTDSILVKHGNVVHAIAGAVFPHNIDLVVNAGSTSLINNSYTAIDGAGHAPILTQTINIPNGVNNGDVIELKFEIAITTITQGTGTILNFPTAAVAGAYYKWVWDNANASWY